MIMSQYIFVGGGGTCAGGGGFCLGSIEKGNLIKLHFFKWRRIY